MKRLGDVTCVHVHGNSVHGTWYVRTHYHCLTRVPYKRITTCRYVNLGGASMKCKSDAIHNLILSIEAVSSPIDESGVWVRSEGTGDDVVMFNGPLVGILSFPGDPGHVNVFMRTMEGDVLYIDPQNTTKVNRVTRNRIVFKGVDSSAVAIGLCGPDTSLVRDAVRRMSSAGGGGGSLKDEIPPHY